MSNSYNLVVLAAGMATRYGGIKQLEGVGPNGETLLEYSSYDAQRANCDKIIFIIRKSIEKDFREKVFDKIAKKYNAEYVFQETTTCIPQSLISYAESREKPYGTIQAILSAAKNIDNNFVVINADDFYGRNSYMILKEHFNKSSANALVGYILGQTLSDTGTVNRGICRFTGKNKLAKIEETYKIQKANGKIVGKNKEDADVELKEDDIASMNFFGFNKNIIAPIEDYWSDFVATIQKDNTKECLLPVFCNEKLIKNEIAFDCYTATDKWIGMTYKEDRDLVKSTIKDYISKGIYPDIL